MPRQRQTIGAVEAYLALTGEAYLVGSANWGLPALAADHDYALSGDTLAIGADVARRFSGRSVVMDAVRRHVRVALSGAGVLDLAPLAGGSLSTDLAARDFTLNAVAAALPERQPVLDPFRGLTDLRHGLVRQVSAGAMLADPLRVLRAVRLLSERGFQIEEGTLASMAAAAPGLARVQPERLHGELVRALSGPGWHAAALLLLDLGAWPALPLPVRLAPDRQAYRTLVDGLRSGQALLAGVPLPSWAGAAQAEARPTFSAVVAAAMLAAGLTPAAMAEAARGLRCTRHEAGDVEHLGRAGYAVAAGEADVGTLVDDYGGLALSAAAMAGRPDLAAALLAVPDVPANVLPGGAAILRRLGRPSGPWLGVLLRDLRRAALRGEVRDRQDAWRLAAKLAARDNSRDAAGVPPPASALETGDDDAG